MDHHHHRRKQEHSQEYDGAKSEKGGDGATINNHFRIIVPQHVSLLKSSSSSLPIQSDVNNKNHEHRRHYYWFVLRVYRNPGVAWRGLVPIFLEAPGYISQRLAQLLAQNSRQNNHNNQSLQLALEDALMILQTSRSQNNQKRNKKLVVASNRNGNNGDHVDSNRLSFLVRSITLVSAKTKRSLSKRTSTSTSTNTGTYTSSRITIFVQPPFTTYLDTKSRFTAVILQTERKMLQLQSLAAWFSTLGGGYFFCRHLSKSLVLARQQRALALQIGNIEMARQCTINEAYNLIYAGKFGQAQQVLNGLEREITVNATTTTATNTNTCHNHSRLDSKNIHIHGNIQDIVTLKQCQAARLLARRLKRMAKRLKRYHTTERQNHTIDDYQRIRIVQD